MKNQNGLSTIELLASLATIAGIYGLTLTITPEVEREVNNYVEIQQKQRAQICKIRPSMCQSTPNN